MMDAHKKIKSALRRELKYDRVDLIDDVMHRLTNITALCGEVTHSIKMQKRMGRLLLRDNPTIIAPACPDYSHMEGKYTFRSLGKGIPLLAQVHCQFLKSIADYLPDARIIIALADHEADDALLCDAVGVSHKTFCAYVAESVAKTNTYVSEFGWTACAMTHYIPTLVDDERRIVDELTGDPHLQRRIDTETLQRGEMYTKISRSLSFADMRARTIKTAAQYIALGTFAAEHNAFVCNHTTTNLSWYLQTPVSVLHNPISVY